MSGLLRCFLNPAGTVPPGHRLLCWRKECGPAGSAILSVPHEGCGHVLPRSQEKEANVELEVNEIELEQELPGDKPAEGVQQDEQPQELAQSGRKQSNSCQLFEPAR